MTTSSSSSMNVGLTVAEEANELEALPATKWTMVSGIQKLAGHSCMLVSAITSESSSAIIFSAKI